ncbi:MAG: ABC transporter substrate-binding protein [Promethearchaeota archaeon]
MKKSVLLRKRNIQLFFVALMVLLPIVMASRFSLSKARVKDDDTLTYANIALPPALDPAEAYDSLGWMVLYNCYDSLLDYAPGEDQLVPSLATEVPSVVNGGINPDGLTYRFHIRPDVYFHDGSLLTAEDVEYSIERVMVYDLGPSWMLSEPLTEYWPEIIADSVEVDGNDVIFHLVSPYVPFLRVLATPVASIVSKQWCIEHGDWPGTAETIQEYRELGPSALDTATMGAGPFMLESWTEDDEMVLVRSPWYWKGRARTERVILKSVPNWEDRKKMFLKGYVDIVVGVPADAFSELDAADGVRVYTGLPTLVISTARPNRAISPYSGFVGSGMLEEDGIPLDFFDDLDIRKAFAYAFDYQGLIDEHWGGEAIQPASIVIEGFPFHNPNQEKYSLDLDQAMLHFQQAMGGQVWENGFTFAIPYNTGNDVRKAMAESIETNIEAINPKFHIDVVEVSWSEFFWSSLFGENPLVFMGWGADYPDPDNLVTPFMLTGSFYYWMSGYSDPYVDDLIQQGRSELDPSARELIYFELQQIYHDDVVGIPIAQPLGRHYERTWVHGFTYNQFTPIDFYPMWIDEEDV